MKCECEDRNCDFSVDFERCNDLEDDFIKIIIRSPGLFGTSKEVIVKKETLKKLLKKL